MKYEFLAKDGKDLWFNKERNCVVSFLELIKPNRLFSEGLNLFLILHRAVARKGKTAY